MDGRSDYEITEQTEEHILIRDLELGNRSLLDDAEIVLFELAGNLYGRRVFIENRKGIRHEIIIKNNKFSGIE